MEAMAVAAIDRATNANESFSLSFDWLVVLELG
jgi:hypothetical protein